MLLNEEVRMKLDEALSAEGKPFDELVKISGLKPSVDLRFSDLRNVDFAGSVLVRWDLTGADLTGASFANAKLIGCNLSRTTGLDLSGAEVIDNPEIAFSRSSVDYAVLRALADFRATRPILVQEASTYCLALAVDGIDRGRLDAFRYFSGSNEIRLVITARRARALGIETAGPIAIKIQKHIEADTIYSLIADADRDDVQVDVEGLAGEAASAGIELAKVAGLLPALLVAEMITPAVPTTALTTVTVETIMRLRSQVTQSVEIAGEAKVPLQGGVSTRFVSFRDAIGGKSVAILVGDPDFSKPVPVRLHSACLTGDVFLSSRCDCHEQLQLAIKRLNEEGGGVVLYLDQDGRGLGLVNKMRAYALQDEGLDTVDANTTLGFDDDERDYGIAARMLQKLGCTSIYLMTNNPAKFDALSSLGIEVVKRIPLHGQITPQNRRYMTAKGLRAGHKLDHLMVALAADADGAPKAGRKKGGPPFEEVR